MKLLIASLFVLSSYSAFSASTLAEKLFAKADPLVHNGECNVAKYDVRNFNYQVEMKKFSKAAFGRFGRDANISYKFSDVLYTIKYSVAVGHEAEDEFQTAVKNLVREKKVKTMFSATPGESCEDSESCSITEFDIYFIDGSTLSCNFDYTT